MKIIDERYEEAAIRQTYEQITKALIKKGMTLTTMESCTSGQIISLITDTEGASAVVKGAYVTYSNEAKIMQGVPAEVIETYGVYSKETAIAMAQTCRKSYGSDIGIGITGTLGNVDPANQDSVPGHVYFAIARKGKDTISAAQEKNFAYNDALETQEKNSAYNDALETQEKNSACNDVLETQEMDTVFVYERELQNWPTRYQYKLEIAQAVAEALKRKIEEID